MKFTLYGVWSAGWCLTQQVFSTIFWHLQSSVQVFIFFFFWEFYCLWREFQSEIWCSNMENNFEFCWITTEVVFRGKNIFAFIVHCHDNRTWKIINKRQYRRDANKRFINFNPTAINFVISLISTESTKKTETQRLNDFNETASEVSWNLSISWVELKALKH